MSERKKERYRKYLDILHLYYTGYLERSGRLVEKIAPLSAAERRKSVVRQFVKLLLTTPADLLGFIRISRQEDTVWLYTVSKNNSDVLKQFHNNGRIAGKTKFVSTQSRIPSYGIAEVSYYAPAFRLFYLPGYFGVLRSLKKVDALRTRRLSSLIFSVVGMQESCRFILKKARPRAIVFTNDINPASRALLLAALELGIPTVYLQHASVTPFFPPLQFNLSLLEGKAAMDQYLSNGTADTQRISLIGAPKFDETIRHQNRSAGIGSVGICSNLADDPEKIKSLIGFINNTFPEIRLTFRPHPRQNAIPESGERLLFSDPLQESVQEFLLKQDMIIANNSNILLEATMLNVVALKYNLSTAPLSDPYGFVKNKVVDEIGDMEALRLFLDKYAGSKPDVQHRARYYNEAIGSSFEGRSADYAGDLINKLIEEVSRK